MTESTQLMKLQKNGNIVGLEGDVTEKTDLERIASVIESNEGYVNLVVANSGISGPSPGNLAPNTPIDELQASLWGTNDEDFARTFRVNSSAVFFTVVAFLKLLDAGNKKGNLEQKSQVIAVSSIGAFNRSPLAGFAYSASKAGVVHMMKQFATALVPWAIRSNVIAPGCT
jgi:NAD(P)-dependent dehydrogenase (short-subunit alcohol dehydrogenase family)